MLMSSSERECFKKIVDEEFEQAKKFLEATSFEAGIEPVEKLARDLVLMENCLIDYECLENNKTKKR